MKGLAEWETPEAGLFFWFRLLIPSGDSAELIQTVAFKNGVLALPGTVFLPRGGKTAYVRASFSLLDEDDVDKALKRLKEAIIDARGDV